MFAVQVVVPVILAPLIFEESGRAPRAAAWRWSPRCSWRLPGVVALAGSPAVGAVIESAHAED